jgi:hypothetical protein
MRAAIAVRGGAALGLFFSRIAHAFAGVLCCAYMPFGAGRALLSAGA